MNNFQTIQSDCFFKGFSCRKVDTGHNYQKLGLDFTMVGIVSSKNCSKGNHLEKLDDCTFFKEISGQFFRIDNSYDKCISSIGKAN